METKKKMTKNLKLMLFGGALSILLCFAVVALFPTVKVKSVYSMTPVPNTGITPTALKPYVLETPFGDTDFTINKYANSSFYAVNMSNFDNFVVSTNLSYVANTCFDSGMVTVKFGPLTATITAPIVMGDNDTLEGAGAENTVFTAVNSLNNPVIQTLASATPHKGVVISNIGIDGNEANQAPANYPTNNPQGIFLADCDEPIVRYCKIVNCEMYGVWHIKISSSSGYCTGGLFTDNELVNCNWNALMIGTSGGTALYCRVTNNRVSQSADVGIAIYGYWNLVTDNVISECQGALGDGGSNSGWGIGLEEGGNNTVASNIIRDSDTGIGVSCGWNTLTDNECQDMDDAGIVIYSSYTYVNGLKMLGNTHLRSVYFNGGDNATVTGVVDHECAGWSIQFEAGSNGNFVVNNDLSGCADDINDGGTSNVYGYNRWRDGTYDTTPP